MKKIIASVVAVVLLVMTFAPVALAETVPGNLGKSYTAGKATVTVDGVVDEIWAAVPFTKIDVPFESAYPDPNYDYMGCDVQVKVLYDDTYLYFLVVAVNADEFGNDVIEIYVEEGEKTEASYSEFGYQARISYDPAYPDDGLTIMDGTKGNPDLDFEEVVAQTALALSADKKTATMEFAFKRLNPDAKDGATLGLEFMYTDWGTMDGIEFELNNYRWNICEIDENDEATGITRPYEESLNFGDLVLGPKAELATATPAPTEAPADDNTDNTGDTTDEKNNTVIYIVVAAVVVAAVVVAVIVVSKKKK